jgi:hypothetical protein
MATRAVTVCRETLGQATKHYPLGGIFAAIVPMAVLHDDRGGESNPIRVIDAFVDALDLAVLGFGGVGPENDWPAGVSFINSPDALYLHIYGYLNRVQSSRRLERWLLHRRLSRHHVCSAMKCGRFCGRTSLFL